MKRFMTAIGLSSLMLVSAPAAKAEPQSRAVIAKLHLSECMTKRMAANKTLSYNDARRACKERLQPPKELASINQVEPATKAH